ncbi:uncharacterized protein [Procambarus clarkii]|uniref:uncharacterized protein n=1 Tax=Procambarus clarkii TaxID=6728 RepID=UPI00374494F9
MSIMKCLLHEEVPELSSIELPSNESPEIFFQEIPEVAPSKTKMIFREAPESVPQESSAEDTAEAIWVEPSEEFASWLLGTTNESPRGSTTYQPSTNSMAKGFGDNTTVLRPGSGSRRPPETLSGYSPGIIKPTEQKGSGITEGEEAKGDEKQEPLENSEALINQTRHEVLQENGLQLPESPPLRKKADASYEPPKATAFRSPPSKDMVSQKKEFWDKLVVKNEQTIKGNTNHTHLNITSGGQWKQEIKKTQCVKEKNDCNADTDSNAPSSDSDNADDPAISCMTQDEHEKNLVSQKKSFWDDLITKRDREAKVNKPHETKKVIVHEQPVTEQTLATVATLEESRHENESYTEIMKSKTTLGRKLSITIKKGTVKANQQKYNLQKEDEYTKWKKMKDQKRRRPVSPSKEVVAASVRLQKNSLEGAACTSRPKTEQYTPEAHSVRSSGQSKKSKVLKKSRVASPRPGSGDSTEEEETHSPKRVRRKVSVKIQRGLVQKCKTRWETTRTKPGYWTWKRTRMSSYSTNLRKLPYTPRTDHSLTDLTPPTGTHLSPVSAQENIQAPLSSLLTRHHNHQGTETALGNAINLPQQQVRALWEQERYMTPSPTHEVSEGYLTPDEAQQYLSGIKGNVAQQRKRFDSLGSVVSTESADSLGSVDYRPDLDICNSPVILDKEYANSVVGKVRRQRNMWETKFQRTQQEDTKERSTLQAKKATQMDFAQSSSLDMLPAMQITEVKPSGFPATPRESETRLYILHNTIEGDLVLQTYDDSYKKRQGSPPSDDGSETGEDEAPSKEEKWDEASHPIRRKSVEKCAQRYSLERTLDLGSRRVPPEGGADEQTRTKDLQEATTMDICDRTSNLMTPSVLQPKSSLGSSEATLPGLTDGDGGGLSAPCEIGYDYEEYKRSFASAKQLFETGLKENASEPPGGTTRECVVPRSGHHDGATKDFVESTASHIQQIIKSSDESTNSMSSLSPTPVNDIMSPQQNNSQSTVNRNVSEVKRFDKRFDSFEYVENIWGGNEEQNLGEYFQTSSLNRPRLSDRRRTRGVCSPKFRRELDQRELPKLP